MTVSQKLQVARNLVAQGWTAGSLVSLGWDGRVRFCARGALNKAFLGSATTDAEFQPDDELHLAQRLVAEAMLGRYLVESDPAAARVAIREWNDSQFGRHGQERVVAAFDAAIVECERLEDEAEKALAEEFTMLPATQGESHQRRDPTLTTTGAPTSANHTHRSPGRHRRLADDAEKELAEEFTMLPVTQGESHQRRDPTLTTTGAPTFANHTHSSHGRHRTHRLDRPHPRPPTNVAQRGSGTAHRPYRHSQLRHTPKGP